MTATSRDAGPDAFSYDLAQLQLENAEATPDLRIRARVGAGYSTDGGSYPALGRFESFVPLWQTVGEELGFLEGRLILNTTDTVAGGLLLGYRGYNDEADRVRGGYLGLDVRGTDASTVYQLGTGYESLGRDWDFRFNAYWPVGNRDRTLRNVDIDTGVQTSTRFQGNLLLLETQRQRQRLLQRETALGGFDAEAGTPIARWDDGNLKGFGGLYLYGAPNLSSYLGWRLRLAADLTPNFSTGLALQGDGLFGNRLIFSVGATFPGIRPAETVPQAEQVRARLGEPTVRLPEVAVFVISEAEAFSSQDSQPLLNPEEEEAYRFQHVALGRAGGDGTFENPFGTVENALLATVSDGNDVVYIDGAADVLIPALTIPDRVQVLSQGPRQLLAGLPFPGFESATVRLPFSAELNYTDGILVELPFSGDGSFPRMTGVTLGNRTVLAGFRFENAPDNAIAGSNIRNVELRNNTITNPGERGIFLDDVGGSAILFDNAIAGSQGAGPTSGQGIFIRNTTTLNSVEATIAGFQADRNRVGIELAAEGAFLPAAQVPNQRVTLGPSSPSNTSIGLSPGTAITNSASNNAAEGVLIRAQDLGGQEVALRQVNISDNGSDGLSIVGGVLGGALISFQEVQVRDSAIARNAGAGIRVTGNESATQELNIDGNQILNNTGAGITSTAGDSALQEFVAKPEINSLGIGNNTIAGNGGIGLALSTNDADTVLIEASQNQFANNAGGGLDTQVNAANTARVCFVAFSNTGSPSIELNNTTTGQFQVSDLTNLSFNNDGGAVALNPSAASYTNIASQRCLP
ncbi:MAG: right-handed parallel beta-helix repeat-containing protein [Nodosilinea sp.]